MVNHLHSGYLLSLAFMLLQSFPPATLAGVFLFNLLLCYISRQYS